MSRRSFVRSFDSDRNLHILTEVNTKQNKENDIKLFWNNNDLTECLCDETNAISAQ